ncbi:ABC transporter substrate-binding protein [Alteribacillus iranensis]|uniref:Iron(III) transport system substrate-binding protein n=1 Tax=Alteribacillus iranensis TaxID=930128 RepID=A0A1I2DJ24_9BACI|nr:ABC transporter substrate-binding protein [Alteribacillus iranensis]SFE80233.1 iron(III) transport system substrate-binding protein [Alteribacillus iranensis]
MKRLRFAALFTASALFIGGCSTSGEADQPKESTEGNTQETTTEASSGGGTESGELVIYSSGPGGMAEELAEQFEEQSGVEVELFQSTTGDVLGRLEAEQSNPVADVVVLASLQPAVDYMENGLIRPYESEYADQLHDGWYDEDYHFYGFSAAALGLSYNTDLIEEPPREWEDLTHEAYQDQIAIPSPSESGTARDFVAAYIAQEGEEEGWAFFEELRDNGLSMEGSNNPALTSVINGANGVVMAGVDYMVYNNIEGGEPLDIVFPESGTTITPRPAFILESAENVEEAEKYIDFILSDEGQGIVADHYLLPAREDIPPHEDRAAYDEIAELDFEWEYLFENGEDILSEFTEMMR